MSDSNSSTTKVYITLGPMDMPRRATLQEVAEKLGKMDCVKSATVNLGYVDVVITVSTGNEVQAVREAAESE